MYNNIRSAKLPFATFLKAMIRAIFISLPVSAMTSIASFPSYAAGTQFPMAERCAFQETWRTGQRYSKCMSLLPQLANDSEGWLVAMHMDRAPTVIINATKRGNLRGRIEPPTHRELPHQYFVEAMRATLHAISKEDPGASVNLAIFTEGRWGDMVDENGVPVELNIPRDMCRHFGLQCTQGLVLLNDEKNFIPDALECIASADVFVSSEDEFSQAAATLSRSVKVLTDRWEMDEDERMIALNPAMTIAGLRELQRSDLRMLMEQFIECSDTAKMGDAVRAWS